MSRTPDKYVIDCGCEFVPEWDETLPSGDRKGRMVCHPCAQHIRSLKDILDGHYTVGEVRRWFDAKWFPGPELGSTTLLKGSHALASLTPKQSAAADYMYENMVLSICYSDWDSFWKEHRNKGQEAEGWKSNEENRRLANEWVERHPDPQLEDLLGEKLPMEVVQALNGEPGSDQREQVLPPSGKSERQVRHVEDQTEMSSSEEAATRAMLNDYLERKAQSPPSPQVRAKRARLLNKLSDLFGSPGGQVPAVAVHDDGIEDQIAKRVLAEDAKDTTPMSQSTYTFNLASGRRVWLNAFHYDQIYAGLMAGRAKNEAGYILSQKTKAEAMWGSRPSYTIPPATIIRDDGTQKYESWPKYCYKAWLMSDELNSKNAGSELIVIWFAEKPIELSLVTAVEEACRDVPWEQYAQDWDF